MYKTENYGVFLGLMTMPFGDEPDFIQYEIRNLFAQYKENIEQNLEAKVPDDSPFAKSLYLPKAYCLFGNFDLAVFSLVDDFSLGTRNFHPFSPLIEKKLKDSSTSYRPQNYTFHIISGTAPDFKYINPDEPSLLEKANATFLKKENADFPLIGITSVKLNNGFLVGGGGSFVDLVLKKLRSVIHEKEDNQGNLECLIFHSFSWHEITIVFFSNSYSLITNKILKLRELTFGDLEPTGGSQAPDVFKEVRNRSLLARFMEKDLKKKPDIDALHQSHVFVHTHTAFGYDIDLLLQRNPLPFNLHDKDEFKLSVQWNIKPGHLHSFLKDLETRLKENQIDENTRKLIFGKITAGRGDYTLLIEENTLQKFNEIVHLVIKDKLIHHVRKINSTPELSDRLQIPDQHYIEVEKHYLLHDKLSKFRFPIEEITQIRSTLKKLRISKILREKVTNMFVIFNDGVHDPVLYAYFIELRPFLQTVIAILENLEDQRKHLNVVSVSEHLDKLTEIFELGYKNRFGQSYIMNEITDFNIDFNGGIQQLLLAYDGAYKSLTSLMGEQGVGRSMAYVSGHSNIESDILSVRLNYFHLYQPEFFAAAATHEAANHFFNRVLAEEDEEDDLWIVGSYLENDHFSLLEKSVLRYFFMDIVSYYFTYANDFELFFFWHWTSFLQTSLAYNLDGSLQQELFNKFMLRMFLMDAFLELGYFDKPEPPFGIAPATLSQAWKIAYEQVRPLASDIASKHQEPYLNPVRDFVLGLMTYEFVDGGHRDATKFEKAQDAIQNEEAIQQKILKKFLHQPNTHLRSSQAEIYLLEYIRYARQEYSSYLADKIVDQFKKGEVFNFNFSGVNVPLAFAQDSFFFQTLFLGYLRLTKEIMGDKVELLDRTRSKGEVQLPKKTLNSQHSKIKLDPFGGMYLVDAEMRADYYKYRVLFLKSLWTLSSMKKIKMFGFN